MLQFMSFIYTFRFTCQLAITEFNLNRDSPRKSIPSTSYYEPQPTNPVVRNLNIGFAVDFESKVGNSIHNLHQLEGHMDHVNIDKISLESTASGRNVVFSADLSKMKENSLHNQQVFDTFEQCLHITNELESAIAYYYKDEDDAKRYNFEEIFDIDEMDIDIPSPTERSENSDKDLSWDSYVEMKPEIEQETEDFIHDVLCIRECNHNSENLPGLHPRAASHEAIAKMRHNSWSNTVRYTRSGAKSLKDVGPLSKSLRDIKAVDSPVEKRSQSHCNVALL